MPCIGNPAYSFRPILLKLYRFFAAFLWFHMRNLSLAGYNCSGGASCMACSFIITWHHVWKWWNDVRNNAVFTNNEILTFWCENHKWNVMWGIPSPLIVFKKNSLYGPENLLYAICEQQRHRSACPSAQSDKRLWCLLHRWYNTSICYSRNFKTLASLISWAGRFKS